jgi:hypothetical protein
MRLAKNLVSVLLLLVMLIVVSLTAHAQSESNASVSRETLRPFQKQDLKMIRELDARVRKGEISERERAELWQAYLARLSAERKQAVEGSSRRGKFPVFTGPGL